MKIKSYFMNMRRRWGIIPRVWNKFFSNLEDDYNNYKAEIDDHEINDDEETLRSKITTYVSKEGI